MTGYQSKKKAASAKTIDEVNWADHEPDGLAHLSQESVVERVWFTIDELNAWADKKLAENPHWVMPAEEPERKEALAQPAQEPEHYPHTWGKDGERCVVCGDKDWMGTSCKKISAPQPEQEPVGEVTEVTNNGFKCEFNQRLAAGTKLYTTPPQRKPLTVDEAISAVSSVLPVPSTGGQTDYLQIQYKYALEIVRAIEAAHGIKEKNT